MRSRRKTGLNIATPTKRRVVAWRRADSDEGTVLVEFALVFPIFAIMLFGMLQFGIVLYGWTSLRNSAQAAVGVAASDNLGSDCTLTNSPNPSPYTCTLLANGQPCTEGTQGSGTVNVYTADLICSIADEIGQPTGTSGSPNIGLLVQNGVITACTQIGAENLTGFFPGMGLSSAGAVYVENPPSALLTATFHNPTVIDGHNNKLTYDINGIPQTVIIPPASDPGGYTSASSLALAVEGVVTSPSVPSNMQLEVSPVGGNLQFQPSLSAVAEVAFQVSGSAVDPSALDFSGVTSADNDYVENYNPDGFSNCAALDFDSSPPAPTTVSVGTDIDPGSFPVTLPGSNVNATGTITFTVFGPSTVAPTDCTGSGPAPYTQLGTSTVTGEGSYESSGGFTATQTGDYWWYASYSGDPDDDAGSSLCGSGMPETVVTGP